jgi:hypothetical protein
MYVNKKVARRSRDHLVQQGYRVVRLFVAALVTQALAQLVVNGNVSQWDRKVVISLIVAAAEAVWRQINPTTPPAPVDPPADTTGT